MKKLINSSWRKVSLCFTFAMLSLVSTAQEFPILLHANGQDVFVESMDIGPSGDIFVTGRTGQWNQFTFNPCGWNVFYTPPPCVLASGQHDIFIARFHPDDIVPGSNNLVWMVVGRSSLASSPSFHSGKDIEVDSGQNSYVVGTMSGDVKFQKIWPSCTLPYPSCPTTTINRHFVGKFDPNGEPLWIADARPDMWSETFGEALTLDEGNNRLFTGGYATTNAPSDMIYMRNADCTDGCSFLAVPNPTGNVGFVSEYDLNGKNYRVGEVGEKVMALTMDVFNPEHVWATGSRYNADLDVLLADLHMDVITDTCVNFSVNMKGIFGEGDDIGLDIACANNGYVMLTGAFTHNLSWTESPAGSIGVPAGSSEIFVGRYGTTTGFTSTSAILTGLGSTVSGVSYADRTSSIAADNVTPGSNEVIIGYEAHPGGVLETQDIDYLFTPLSPAESIFPSGSGNVARAMEIEYGNGGASDNRLFAGDFYMTSGPGFDFGGICTMGNGWFNEGFVTRLDNTHNMTNIALNTDEIDQNLGVKLFPNPAEDQLTISSDEEIESLTVYDSEGRVLISKDKLNTLEHSLDISDFSPGLYLFEIKSNDRIVTRKLIVN